MRIQLLLFSVFTFVCVSGQHIVPENEGQPAWEARNQYFIDQRQTSDDDNFAKNYFSAHKQMQSMQPKNHAKAEATWTPRGPFGNDDLAGIGRINSMQFHPTDTNTWFICVAQGGLWKTTNAGQSWISISGNLPILRISYLTINPKNPDEMYVALGDFAYLGHNLQANENKRNSHYGLGIYKTTDGGNSWSATGLSFAQTDFEGSLMAKVFIHPLHTDTVIAVGQTGAFLSHDGGQSWTKTHNKLFWDLEMNSQNPDVLYATTGYVHTYQYGEANILKSYDFGETWVELSSNIPKVGIVQRIELAIAPSDSNYIYAIACDNDGGFYGFYRSTNAGNSWSLRKDNTYQYNILNNSLDDEKGGQGRYDLAICVDKSDKNRVFIGGINMWQTKDGGSSFIPVTWWLLNYYHTSMHADIHEIVQHPTGTSVFACHDGGISRSFSIEDDNVADMTTNFEAQTEWVNYTKGLNITSFYRLSVNQLKPNEIMAGAQDNSTVFGDGKEFVNVSGGDGMECLFMDDAGYRYSSSQNGNIEVFSVIGSDMFYEGRIGPPQNEIGEWTTPFVEADGKMFVLYGNLYDTYFTFLDKNYTGITTSSGVPAPGTALAIEKSNANRMYFAKRGYASQGIKNSIYTSPNSGQKWDNIGSGLPDNLYPSYLEMNQDTGNQVWITFAGFDSANKVFFSKDAGQNWQNITYNLPNTSVNCVTLQPDGSGNIYVGTDMGVFYLLKDTNVWQPYNNGLPPVIVSELEVDTTNKTLVAATFGRGLWEVGLLPYTPKKDGVTTIENVTSVIQLYPNPVKEVLYIEFADLRRKNVELKIVDITGKVVFAESNDRNDSTQKVDVSHLLSGEYFVVATFKLGNFHHREVQRFVKY
ncbi:MAG: T9SS type A sorting domain-containing protein [Flavobacteriales bacterium]|nr:T9SS type A sorting domain-containing protein [Flavobacteriales bacterium]